MEMEVVDKGGCVEGVRDGDAGEKFALGLRSVHLGPSAEQPTALSRNSVNLRRICHASVW
jgi:hypothetical protein